MPSFETVRGPIHLEQHGSRADEPLLLINGLGQQLIHWPESFIQAFTAAGLRVVTFDNRDAGLSFRVNQPPAAVAQIFSAARQGAAASATEDGAAASALTPPYSLAEMAADAVALLDHLGQAGAHIVGFSLGGMIAQRVAIHFPERAFSLTSMLAGAGPFPVPADDGLRAAIADPAPSETEAALVERAIAAATRLGGSHHNSASAGFGRNAGDACRRAWEPAGAARQLMAGVADEGREAALRTLCLPTLVIAGAADPVVSKAACQALADAIPSARLQVEETLGHDLPEPLIPQIAAGIVALARGTAAKR